MGDARMALAESSFFNTGVLFQEPRIFLSKMWKYIGTFFNNVKFISYQ